MRPSANLNSSASNLAGNEFGGRFYSFDETHYNALGNRPALEQHTQRLRTTNAPDAPASEWPHRCSGGSSTRSLFLVAGSPLERSDAVHLHHDHNNHCHHQPSPFACLEPIQFCARVPYRASPPPACNCNVLRQDQHLARVCPTSCQRWSAQDQDHGPQQRHLAAVHANYAVRRAADRPEHHLLARSAAAANSTPDQQRISASSPVLLANDEHFDAVHANHWPVRGQLVASSLQVRSPPRRLAPLSLGSFESAELRRANCDELATCTIDPRLQSRRSNYKSLVSPHHHHHHHHHHDHFRPPQHAPASRGQRSETSFRMSERKLSSIIGSDSELCRKSPQAPDVTTAAVLFSSSSASSSLSSPSLVHRQKINPTVASDSDRAPEQSQCSAKLPSRPQPKPRTRPAHPLDGLRLHRQGSSTTSEASFGQQRSQSSQQSSCGPVKLAEHAKAAHDRSSSTSVTGAPTTPTAAKQTADCQQVAEHPIEVARDQEQSKRSGRLVQLAASGKTRSLMHSPISAASSLGKVSLAGAKRRLGFKRRRGLNSLSVHRSEEIFPSELSSSNCEHLLGRQLASTTTNTSRSFNESSFELELQGQSSNWSPRGARGHQLQASWLSRFSSESPDPKICFVDGLGLGQVVSRQALVSPYLGDIQLSLSDRRGMLEVEVIRLRQLQPQQARGKRTPAIYVKVYLMRAKKCLAKVKTNQISHTLDPLFQQLFIFRDDYKNCLLQIIVWANYGKSDRKSLVGLAQIHLDELDISSVVVGWYRLFNVPSMVASQSVASSSKSLRRTLSTAKLADSSLHR